MRKYYITDNGLRQVEIQPPSAPSIDDKILMTLADYPEGMTRHEIMLYLHYEETVVNIAQFQRTLQNLMNIEYVVYEDE